MMNRKLTTAELRVIGQELMNAWEKGKSEIKLPGRSLHALIGLKKKIENELMIVEETIMGLAVQFGATPNQDGSATIPEDRREEAFKALGEFSKELVEIEYRTICIGPDDFVPVGILEAFYDFIEFAE